MSKFSIITTTFNTKPSDLKRMLESLNNQTLKCFNIIFLDDGSSIENINEYKKIIDIFPLKIDCIFLEKNIGINKNRDYILEIKKEEIGEWIVNVDSDDWVEPSFLSYIYEHILSNDNIDYIKFLGLNFVKFVNSAKITEYTRFSWANSNFYKSNLNCFYDKHIQFIDNNQGYDPYVSSIGALISGLISTVFSKKFFYEKKLRYSNIQLLDLDCKNYDFLPSIIGFIESSKWIAIDMRYYNYVFNSSNSISNNFNEFEVFYKTWITFDKLMNIYKNTPKYNKSKSFVIYYYIFLLLEKNTYKNRKIITNMISIAKKHHIFDLLPADEQLFIAFCSNIIIRNLFKNLGKIILNKKKKL